MRTSRTKLLIIIPLFIVSTLIALPLKIAAAQTTTVSASPQSSSPLVGQTFTVAVEISDVQNLYAIDVTLNWNPSILQFVSAALSLDANAHPGGVLYGSPVSSVPTNGGILLQTNTGSQSTGEYDLVATSENPADSFNGSGTMVTLTFTATTAGYSPLTLTTSLADHPAPGDVAEFITHNDVSSSVNPGLSSSTLSPSSSPSSSPSPSQSASASPSPSTAASPTPKVPEIPSGMFLATIFFSALIVVLFSRKAFKRHSVSTKMQS